VNAYGTVLGTFHKYCYEKDFDKPAHGEIEQQSEFNAWF
jgi:hypothetical protein